MKTLFKRLKYWLIAALVIPIGCTTQKKATNYFAQHPDKFAKACDLQFPVQTNTTTVTLPGKTIFVDCDSVIQSLNNTPINQPDGVANALGNTTKRRALVPVYVPGSTIKTVEIVNTKAVEAEKQNTIAERERANKAEIATAKANAEIAKQKQRADTSAKWLRISLIVIAAYILLRICKSYISKIPVVGLIAKFIL